MHHETSISKSDYENGISTEVNQWENLITKRNVNPTSNMVI